MIQLKKILVPVDFSESSKLAFTYAASFSLEFGSEIHLLHVIEEETIHVGSLEDPRHMGEKWEKESLQKLGEFVDAPYKELPVVLKAIGGEISDTIFSYAQENNVDLIIMGARGQSGFVESLLGSTSYDVARKAPCPVLTVKPYDHPFISA